MKRKEKAVRASEEQQRLPQAHNPPSELPKTTCTLGFLGKEPLLI